jgi:cytochrome c oxidase subunit 2
MNPLANFWPERASAYAGQIDLLMWAFTAVVALLAGPVIVLIVWFSVKYRRGKPADRSRRVNSSTPVEVSWTIAPFVLTIGFFVYAAWLYLAQQRAPANALAIDVVAKQWMWKFQHPEGQREINDLHVPANQPVKLVMTSQDVIHDLYLPELRIKKDVLPGRYTMLWFKADRPGVYRLVCSQFCGADHSVMGGRFIVMKPADYARWLQSSGSDASLSGQGAALYRRLGCSGCHDVGSTVRAPPLAGLAGRPVALADGRTVRADAQYLHDSILQPNKDVVAGYAPVMPTYANLIGEDVVLELVAYLQALAPAASRSPAQSNALPSPSAGEGRGLGASGARPAKVSGEVSSATSAAPGASGPTPPRPPLGGKGAPNPVRDGGRASS